MPIAVICPNCKASFRVSEKFAGKEGPCPKCKATIKVPVVDEIKIHAPDDPASGKGGTPAPGEAPRPIRRKKYQIPALTLVLIGGGSLLVAIVAFLGRQFFQGNFAVAGAALAVLSIPICVGGYEILRDDELEPFRGAGLWLRAAICGVIYAALWGGFAFLPESVFANGWNWLFIPVPFLLAGTFVAYLCFELSPENCFFHYAFYVLITIVLRALIGLPALWNIGAEAVTVPLY